MITTFVNVPINDVLWNELSHMYPADAYKAVTGAEYLTDVNAGQVIRRLWRVFGPRGIGWGLDIPELLGVDLQPAKKEGWVEATIQSAHFWYLCVPEKGDPFKAKILTAGSSDNKQPGYAVSGAMTSCIKKAISYLGHQNALYCGKVDHKTVKDFPVDGAYMKSLVDEAKELGGEVKDG